VTSGISHCKLLMKSIKRKTHAKMKYNKTMMMIVMTMMIVCFTMIDATRVGEIMPLLSRVQYNNQRTPWANMEMKINPRFATSKTAEINGIVSLLKRFSPQPELQPPAGEQQQQLNHEEIADLIANTGFQEEDTVKLSFSFEEADFVTPWITVMKSSSNTKTHFLTRVDFMFKYAGSKVVQVKHKAHYSDEDDLGLTENDSLQENIARIPSTIKLVYHWEEIIQQDATAGITLLYFISLVAGIGIVLIVLFDFV
jgi:hypothetical protein